MIPMDKQLYVVERSSKNMESCYKVMHISIILVSFVCASFAAICFKFGMNGFAHQCILYANITFKNVESPYTSFDNYTARMLPKNLSTIDNYYTIWGPQYLCDFCHFTIITSAIFSFIWGAFFVICGKGGSALETDELSKPWMIVVPALFFSVVFSILLFESDITLRYGIMEFCAQFEPIFGTKECNDNINYYTNLFINKKIAAIQSLMMAKHTSYFCFMTWVIQSILLAYRLITGRDFQLLVLSIFSAKDEVTPEQTQLTSEEATAEEVAV